MEQEQESQEATDSEHDNDYAAEYSADEAFLNFSGQVVAI